MSTMGLRKSDFSQIHISIFNSFSKLRAYIDFYMSLGEKNEESKFIICTFIIVIKHYESVMVLKLS